MKKQLIKKEFTNGDDNYTFILNHVEKEDFVIYLLSITDGTTTYTVESHNKYMDAVMSFTDLLTKETDCYNRANGIIKRFYKEVA